MKIETQDFNVRLATRPVEFKNYMVHDMLDYQKIDQEYADRDTFDMWEKSVESGQGWLGVVHPEGDLQIEGQFKTYLHEGDYSGLMAACQQIHQDHPGTEEFYIIYLNHPERTKPQDLKTRLIWR